MKRILLPLFSLLVTIVAKSQTPAHIHERPYVLVDSFTTDIKHMVIKSDHIKAISVLKGSEATNVFGDKGRNGVIMITTKPNTTLLRFNQILDKYNIAQADRKLRVCIDQTLINKPELILADETMITAVEITQERRWMHAEDANSTELFINIKTNNKKNSL
ncbi:MAG TPA: hypothetical protein VD794_17065 [Flavisolibacter sp.]|nr:hypothetical protein [Flavisolibacter sp.]